MDSISEQGDLLKKYRVDAHQTTEVYCKGQVKAGKATTDIHQGFKYLTDKRGYEKMCWVSLKNHMTSNLSIQEKN